MAAAFGHAVGVIRAALVVLAAAALAGCGGAKTAGTTTNMPPPAPPPPPPTTTTPVRDRGVLAEFESDRHGQCALTDERTEKGDYLAICINRGEAEEGGIPFLTCTEFPRPGARTGHDVEFHGFPGAQSLPDPKNWRTPGCDAAAKKAAAFLVRHLQAS
jgi:hypothetical protein